MTIGRLGRALSAALAFTSFVGYKGAFLAAKAAETSYIVGRVYATDSGPSLNSDQWGPQLDQTLSGYCAFMKRQETADGFWTYAQSKAVESGYDEVHWSTRVKLLSGPYHPPCKDYARESFYLVEVLNGKTRGGHKRAYINGLWLRNP